MKSFIFVQTSIINIVYIYISLKRETKEGVKFSFAKTPLWIKIPAGASETRGWKGGHLSERDQNNASPLDHARPHARSVYQEPRKEKGKKKRREKRKDKYSNHRAISSPHPFHPLSILASNLDTTRNKKNRTEPNRIEWKR